MIHTDADQLCKELRLSREFFERSTRTLDESDSEFTPQEGMMSAAQHVAHAAHTIDWFINGAARSEGFDLDFSKLATALARVKSLGDARASLAKAYDEAIQFLAGKSAEELARPLPPGPVMGGEPVSDIVWAIVEHTAHHRGALTVYARLRGKVPPMPYAG